MRSAASACSAYDPSPIAADAVPNRQQFRWRESAVRERSATAAAELATDGELVTLALNGLQPAFSRLMERHGPHLRRVVGRRLRNRDDALDVIQDTQLAVWRSLQSYDAGRSFEAWLTTIALNKCRDWARHRVVELGLLSRLKADATRDATSWAARSAEHTVLDAERVWALARALEKLPVQLREPLLLTTLEDMPQASTARRLGLTRKAVEMRVRHARQHLGQALAV
ncbi:MAG: RNA polymerase sigma factor [Steroidobacteraceae bacterium]